MKAKFDENLKSINSALSRTNGMYQQWAQKNNVNYYLIQVLHALYVDSSMTQKQISENYHMPKQTVNNTITSLKKQNYVILEVDELDKRGKKIVFTEQGYEYAEEMLSPILKLDEKVMERMGREKYLKLIDLLNDYGDSLENELDL